MFGSRFENNKSDLKDEILPTIKQIEERNPISFILCDNSIENQEINETIDPLILPLTFKYTPRDTPQHNGVLERRYHTL